MTSKAAVSIIIPVYNTASYVRECILSAISQTHTNKEIIVVDDGSNNETKQALQELDDKIDVLITQDNAGQSTARNKGIQKAKGDYILILDSDDTFAPTFVEKALEILEKQLDVKFVSCYLQRFNETSVGPVVEMQGGTLENYLFRNATIGNGLFRKKDLLAIGGYDETMRNGYEDWELAIRLLKEGGKVFVIPEALFRYRSTLKMTTKKAAQKRPELLSYIIKKHRDIYSNKFEEVIAFFENQQYRLYAEIEKKTSSKEFLLGAKILKPLRLLKSAFKR